VTLRERVLGAWELVSFTALDVDTGRVRHPLGTAPRGLILYTDDGHMSAQLADSDMGDYVAYGGVDGDLLTLSATITDYAGATTHSSLVWRRAGSAEAFPAS
jgi:hypothetical protein